MKTRRTAHQVGRVRRRLAALLATQGFRVEPEHLYPSQGYWRISPYRENYTWSGHGQHAGYGDLPDGFPAHFDSFLTMERLLREGLALFASDNGVVGHYEVWPSAMAAPAPTHEEAS